MQQFLQFIILAFIYSLICFGRPHAHHQELNNCSSSLWFYRWSLVVTVLLVVVGPAGRPDHDQQHDIIFTLDLCLFVFLGGFIFCFL